MTKAKLSSLGASTIPHIDSFLRGRPSLFPTSHSPVIPDEQQSIFRARTFGISGLESEIELNDEIAEQKKVSNQVVLRFSPVYLDCLAASASSAARAQFASDIAASDVKVEFAKAKSQADFYDDNLDEEDDAWTVRERQGRKSDAILSCPACFKILCIDCQRHDKYVHQYRAMFVRNCRIVENEILRLPPDRKARKLRNRKKQGGMHTDTSGDQIPTPVSTSTCEGDELFRPVHCLDCDTEVAVVDKDEVYHFFNVMPSYS